MRRPGRSEAGGFSRSPRPSALLAVAGAGLGLAAGLAGPTVAAGEDTPSIHLQPAGVASVAQPGLRMGPFTIANFTGAPYSLRVLPVLLGQRRDGGLFVRQDPASLAAAHRLLGADGGGFDFAPGAARSVLGTVRRVPRGAGIYGGILFRATPRGRGGGPQLVQILQLDARVMLAPAHQRVRLAAAQPPRVEQDGARRLRVLVPVVNSGNVLAHAGGRVQVRDAAGRVAASARLRGFDLLPGATVDLPGRLVRPGLAAGRYTVSARISTSRGAFALAAPLELFGPDTVRTERAKLVALGAPVAYRGADMSVGASFRNTGNVPYAPAARVELRRLLPGGRPGPLVREASARADRTGPGQIGELRGSVRVPDGPGAYELRVRLAKDGLELDSRTVDVTAVPRPPLLSRLKDWVTGNAFTIVLVLLGAIALGAAFGGRYIRRLRAAARSSDDR